MVEIIRFAEPEFTGEVAVRGASGDWFDLDYVKVRFAFIAAGSGGGLA